MFEVDGKKIENLSLSKPCEILYEFDLPLIFICQDQDGQKFLAYSIASSCKSERFLLSQTNEKILENLKNCKIDLKTALSQKNVYIVDFVNDWDISNCWNVLFENVPQELIAKSGVFLK